MTPRDLIRKKRDGERLTVNDIENFVSGLSGKDWTDYHVTALLMAMFIHGLNQSEQNALVRAMLNSGEVLDFSALDVPVADKHSTGGVGDKTSLIIAPLAAACGIAVPMISGRGLGHTGGTLDKLESIPGYKVRLSKSKINQIIRKCGFVMAGQTQQIVPADRRLYALRDAAGMIESVPLIVSSIMSKKLAEGLGALVLDVKTGSGAFMENLWDAQELAGALVKTGKDFNVRTEAVISDMSQPLGRFVGNSVEVYECLLILRGEGDERMQPTVDLSIDLTSRMLVLTGLAPNLDAAVAKCLEKLWDGSALERFRQNIALQGGDPKVADEPSRLLSRDVGTFELKANGDGFIHEIDTRALGDAICALGGGRFKVTDEVDPAVGFECLARIGDAVSRDTVIGRVFYRDADKLDAISEKLQSAFRISPDLITAPDIIREVIS